MSIRKQLDADMKQAMRDRDQPRLSCIRMLKSKVQEKEVALRGKHGKDHELTDDDVMAVLTTYAKQRRDSIASYREAGREELAATAEAELAILKAFLPEQLDEAAIRELVQKAIADSGAGSMKEIGAVMKLLMPQVKGKADGKQVNAIVRELLGGLGGSGD